MSDQNSSVPGSKKNVSDPSKAKASQGSTGTESASRAQESGHMAVNPSTAGSISADWNTDDKRGFHDSIMHIDQRMMEFYVSSGHDQDKENSRQVEERKKDQADKFAHLVSGDTQKKSLRWSRRRKNRDSDDNTGGSKGVAA